MLRIIALDEFDPEEMDPEFEPIAWYGSPAFFAVHGEIEGEVGRIRKWRVVDLRKVRREVDIATLPYAD